VEDRRVHRAAVGRDGEGSGGVAEERDGGERRPAERRSEVRRVEDPDVGATDTGRREDRLDGRVERGVLPAMRGGDEGAVVARAGKDEVARLVADEQRPDDAPAARVVTSTMLTLSERWFTTQTSVFERAATASGSSPTTLSPRGRCSGPVMSKISSRSSGVLTAKRWLPSGDIASGRTCQVSKRVNEDAALASARGRATARRRPQTEMQGARGETEMGSLGSLLQAGTRRIKPRDGTHEFRDTDTIPFAFTTP
jgi:hypothetical protein